MTIQAVISGDSNWHVEQGGVLEVLRGMPAGFVHCTVTSPPYYGLRDYGLPASVWGGDPECEHSWGKMQRGKRKDILPADETTLVARRTGSDDRQNGAATNGGKFCTKCNAWLGCLGLEPTPELFIEHLVLVFREVRRVLRDDGVCWVNMGDSFSTESKFGGHTSGKHVRALHGATPRPKRYTGLKNLDLVGVPWMLAFALRKDGWYLRSDVVWAKPSAMPESVSGWRWERCRRKIASGKRSEEKSKTAISGKPHAARAGDGKNFQQSKTCSLTKAASRDAGSNGEWIGCPLYEACPGCKKCKKTGGYVLRRGAWRPTRSHEFIFQLSKSERYFCDQEAVRTQLAAATVSRDQYSRILDDPDEQCAVQHDHETVGNPAGANPRDVWPAHDWKSLASFLLERASPEAVAELEASHPDVWWIGPEPCREKHYAAFPTELSRRCIAASTPDHGVCSKCGAPWARIVEVSGLTTADVAKEQGYADHADAYRGPQKQNLDFSGSHWKLPARERNTLGWRATCDCEVAETYPAIILDPFSGTGTTLVVARRMGRRAIGIDLSTEYVGIARKRISSDLPLFNRDTV